MPAIQLSESPGLFEGPSETQSIGGEAFLGKYRIIEWYSNEMDFSQTQAARTEGYLVA